jgi:uncharacterized repeat protein (TIGR01451 family)
VLGPTTTAVGSTIAYQIEVSNPGDLPAENVVVSAELPADRLKFIEGEGQQFGTRREWRIDQIPAKSSQTVTLSCQAVGAGTVSLFVTAENAEVSAPAARAETEILQSALKLTVDLANRQAAEFMVGDKITYNISVTNTSNTVLNNVLLRDTFDAGLAHSDGQTSPIKQAFPNLAPGAVRQLAVSFVAQQAGQLCHRVDVSADGGHTTNSGPKCIRVLQANRDLSVEVTGSAQVTDRERAKYEIVVRNPGDVELTGIVIKATMSPSLNPKDATKGHQVPDTNVLVWRLVSLAPGESVSARRIECEPVAFDEAASVTVDVATDQGLTRSKVVYTKIVPAAGPAPVAPQPRAGNPANLQPPANGALKIELADAIGGATVGQPIRYVLKVTNDRQDFDENIRVNLRFSEAVTFTAATLDGQPIPNVSVQPGRRSASIFFQQMRPREEIVVRIQAQAERAGDGLLDVDVTSQHAPQGVRASESTPIRAN